MQKFDFIKSYFSNVWFSWKSILDAGTGKSSALFLSEKTPEKLTLLTYTWDTRKWTKADQVLKESWSVNHNLVYWDISDKNLFEESSFDLIFADYLLWEVSPSKLSYIFQAISKFLKKDWEIVFIDREFYNWYDVDFNYISMDKIEWFPVLEKRSPRDLIEIVDIFMALAKFLVILNQEIRTFDYPSDWIIPIMKNSWLSVKEVQYFEVEQPIKEEFEQRIGWAKWRILNLENKELGYGLLEELKKVQNEFEKRNISKQEYYLRKHYFIVWNKK